MDLLWLDRDCDTPLYQQIYKQIRETILEGRFAPGSKLPSTRLLADQLNVARIVVVEAFEMLAAEGYIEMHTGSGSYVKAGLRAPGTGAQSRDGSVLPLATTTSPPPLQDLYGMTSPRVKVDFRPGVPALDRFPRTKWAKTLVETIQQTAPPDLDYGPSIGVRGLREAIAGYLSRARGLPADTVARLVITSGAAQAIDLLARTCTAPGETVAVEEPCSPVVFGTFQQRGIKVIPIPVDSQGLCVDMLPVGPGAPRMVYITPSNQFPTGATMPLGRRLSLLNWAEENQALIVEDDYDSEFRYEGQPIQALAGIDYLGRVAYVGTFSKTFFPALRLGYLALPEPLVSAVVATKWHSDRSSPSLEQMALGRWLDSGQFGRHVRAMRNVYARRREELISALRASFGPAVAMKGEPSGLHLYVEFHLGLSEQELVERARAVGVSVYPVSPCFLAATPPCPALIFGYGGVEPESIWQGVALLAQAFGVRSPIAG